MMFGNSFDVENHVPSDLTIVGFIGCDGAGTTTHANHAVEVLESEGYETQLEWMRFEHRLSLPVLGLGRLLGLYEVNDDGEQVIRGHTFEQSKLITKMYKRTLLTDQLRMVKRTFKSVPGNTEVLVCDRYILDALVDLVVAAKDMGFLSSDISKSFWNLIPKRSTLVGLHCDTETIAERRSDAGLDPFLEFRVKAYRNLFKDDRINVVNTAQLLESAVSDVESILEDEI